MSTVAYKLDSNTSAQLRVGGGYLCAGYSHSARTFVAAICDDLDDSRTLTDVLGDPAYDVVRMLRRIDDGPPMRLARSDISVTHAVEALIEKLSAGLDVCALTAGESQCLGASP